MAVTLEKSSKRINVAMSRTVNWCEKGSTERRPEFIWGVNEFGDMVNCFREAGSYYVVVAYGGTTTVPGRYHADSLADAMRIGQNKLYRNGKTHIRSMPL